LSPPHSPARSPSPTPGFTQKSRGTRHLDQMNLIIFPTQSRFGNLCFSRSSPDKSYLLTFSGFCFSVFSEPAPPPRPPPPPPPPPPPVDPPSRKYLCSRAVIPPVQTAPSSFVSEEYVSLLFFLHFSGRRDFYLIALWLFFPFLPDVLQASLVFFARLFPPVRRSLSFLPLAALAWRVWRAKAVLSYGGIFEVPLPGNLS